MDELIKMYSHFEGSPWSFDDSMYLKEDDAFCSSCEATSELISVTTETGKEKHLCMECVFYAMAEGNMVCMPDGYHSINDKQNFVI